MTLHHRIAINEQTAPALRAALAALEAQGLGIATVSEMRRLLSHYLSDPQQPAPPDRDSAFLDTLLGLRGLVDTDNRMTNRGGLSILPALEALDASLKAETP